MYQRCSTAVRFVSQQGIDLLPVNETQTRPICGRDASPVAPISAQSRAVQAALRALNNANARETSFLTEEVWRAFVAGSFETGRDHGMQRLRSAMNAPAPGLRAGRNAILPGTG